MDERHKREIEVAQTELETNLREVVEIQVCVCVCVYVCMRVFTHLFLPGHSE